MYYLRTLYIALLLLSPFQLFATTYEDATNKKIDGWHVVKQFSKGVIKNIYDKKKRSRVIKLDGNVTRTIYMFTPKKNAFKKRKQENILEWEMNYSEDFVIMVGIKTTNGKRFLIYTSGKNDSYLQYGLGSDSLLGEWKKYRRDLQKDLEASEKDNHFLNITNFVIKGSGMVDNIKIVKLEEPSPLLAPEPPEKKIVKPLKEEIKKKEKLVLNRKRKISNSTPTIQLKGKNPLILKKGEFYVEPGAVAKNKDGSNVMITISNDIDILNDGEYSVIYMATNRAGNSVIDRRQVIVGSIDKKREESRKEEPARDESGEEEKDMEQKALEMLEWEKELAFREKELIEQRSRSAVKSVPHSNHPNYPLRPGL